jgi:hypothetical protein
LRKLADISARRKQEVPKALQMLKIPKAVTRKVNRKVRHAAREVEFAMRATRLEESIPEKVFLCEGATRFFWVDVRARTTDLVVKLRCISGTASVYASYSTTTPGPTSWEFAMIRGKLVLKHSEERAKYDRCSLGVYAVTELEATLEQWFVVEPVQQLRRKKRDTKVPEVMARLQLLRDNKRMRATFDEEVSEILRRRASSKPDAPDFVRLNKTLTSFQKPRVKSISKQLSQVKMKRLELREERLANLTAMVDRKKIHELAVTKAQLIHTIWERKCYFDRLWLTSMSAITALDALHARFERIKVVILQNKLEYCMIFKVQRRWKNFLGKKHDFNTRLLLQAHNSCLFWKDNLRGIVDRRNRHSLVNCIKESAYIVTIPRQVEWLVGIVMKIQANWRESKSRELRRMELLVMMWDRTLDHIINGSLIKYRRKRRRQLIEKYQGISPELRDKALWGYYNQAKLTFNLKFTRGGSTFFAFLPSTEEMTELIFKASNRKNAFKVLG